MSKQFPGKLMVAAGMAAVVGSMAFLSGGCASDAQESGVREADATGGASEEFPQRRFLLADGVVHARPDSSASELGVLEEGAPFLVAREQRDGWRKVYRRTEDGRVGGWIRQAKVSAEAPEPLHLMSADLEYEDGGYNIERINGRIQNTTSRVYDVVWIRVRLLDVGGDVVGVSADTVSYVGPAGIWDFEVPVRADLVDSYEVAEISGWPRGVQ